jgi:hypothetical protein
LLVTIGDSEVIGDGVRGMNWRNGGALCKCKYYCKYVYRYAYWSNIHLVYKMH